ncbi:cytochrome P450 [Sphingobium nicotianae]|uniref:Cytochrome P450 n=1 Tax=Sphingobium nicotianae TaxID=2782607 RepID=A0A9X1DA14_9SPHN|nr:cytochrome P450 [Sphingobium nicotianae]MBT2186130.1 cytochrome P450 [Sphingobium nicotianae]
MAASSVSIAPPVLRDRGGVVMQWLTQAGMGLLPLVFRVLRRVRPIARFGNTYLVTRAEDVRAVFETDVVFGVPYLAKLDMVMDHQRFILGMADGPDYRADLAALERVVRRDDLPRLAATVSRMASDIVERSNGWIDVVSELSRPVAFDFVADYLGVPRTADDSLYRWGTRLFEYVFVADDKPLQAEAEQIAPIIRAHVQRAIEQRRAHPIDRDDVLSRCLALQAAGEPGYSDAVIRTALVGLVVGGPPQPPMVLPHAIEQLLRRPAALAQAQAAARADEDDKLWACLMEAMRFDPIAPWLARTALSTHELAVGTPRARTIPAGAHVLACIGSAMRDPARVPEPGDYRSDRPADAYIHFGHGLHECFGRHINRATLHLMLKPLLARPNLRRAKGAMGRLRRKGLLASSLVVEFD